MPDRRGALAAASPYSGCGEISMYPSLNPIAVARISHLHETGRFQFGIGCGCKSGARMAQARRPTRTKRRYP